MFDWEFLSLEDGLIVRNLCLITKHESDPAAGPVLLTPPVGLNIYKRK